MEKKDSTVKASDELLDKEYSLQREKEEHNALLAKKVKRMKHIAFILSSIIVGLIILLFLQKCSGDKKEKNLKAVIKLQDNSIDMRDKKIADLKHTLRNQKAIPIVANVKNGKTIGAKIVSLKDNRPEIVFVPDIIKNIPYKVEVPIVDSTLAMRLKNCNDDNEQIVGMLLETESLLSDSIKLCMDKQYRQDSTVIMWEKSIQLKSFMLNSPPSIDYTHTYIEYLPNSYREKAENAFERAIVAGIFSAGFYAVSEGIGNPIFINGQDNTEAQKLHDQIFWLRVGSAVTGAYSVFEFARVIHFHKMEGKFIINPTKIGLTVNLDKPVKKIKK